MASQPDTLITAEQFYQLPQEEGREFELLDGEVIEISSATLRHNLIVTKLIWLLDSALLGRGEPAHNTDFSDGRYTTLRPDLAILLDDKLTSLDLDKLPVRVPPDIVVEVISPSESALRVERRKEAYLRFGVQEVWLIYPENQYIYVHTEAGVERRHPCDSLKTPLLPGWSVEVNQIFQR